MQRNGTIAAWTDDSYRQPTAPGLTNAIAVAAGYLHSVALLSNGTVVVWGDNSFGQTNVPAALTNIVGIAAGDFFTLALGSDGRVAGWGDNRYGLIDVPAGLANVSAVVCGNYHALALASDVNRLLATHDPSHHVVVGWSGQGTLQCAPSPLGPFSDVSGPGKRVHEPGHECADKVFPAQTVVCTMGRLFAAIRGYSRFKNTFSARQQLLHNIRQKRQISEE